MASAAARRKAALAGHREAVTNWTATLSFYKGAEVYANLSGPVENGNMAIGMDEPWNHFTGGE